MFLFGSPSFSADQKQRPRFHATFLQLWNLHKDFSDGQWDDLCKRLSDFGVEEIILQWSLITERPFLWRLSDGRREKVPHDRVEPSVAVQPFVRAAERAGLQVRFGLTHDPSWWEEIKSDPKLVGVYLHRLWQDQRALAEIIVERFGDSPSFAGFYIPQEIDDKTWLEPQKYTFLSAHLRRLNLFLKEIKPGFSTAISCFFNGNDDPAHVTRFWEKLLSKSDLDFLYIQDGVGTGKLTMDEVKLYMNAVSKVAIVSGAQIRAIVEIFEVADATGDNSSTDSISSATKFLGETNRAAFYGKFRSANMSRITAQLALAESILGPKIIAFSLPEYATPMGGKRAERLGNEYRLYLQGK